MNFSPEDIVRFQAFLNQLSATANTQSEPSSSASHASGTSSILLAPSQSAGSSIPGIPPITQLYHSNRLSQQGQPASSSGIQTTLPHAFIGTRLNLPTTGTANQARLASARNSIPRQVSLPSRGRRRTAAQQPPVLPRALSGINQCFLN